MLPLRHLNRGGKQEECTTACAFLFAVQQAEADMAKVGVGVTKEAQQLFDVLCRTMPCTWHGRSICVMEAVEIEPPYLVESIRSIAGENNVFERVRKVLPAIRNQMGLS
eukprot:GHUV01046320.1.p2 GENE.GHUV01046320.1~~GHUV01046320.1.p2  ORF type:complete len:109 (-),score=14.30 GHUV01046320.1:42-368(-)